MLCLTRQPLPLDRELTTLYANNELDLSNINMYDFDYDYTLATYRKALHYLIFTMDRELLITRHKLDKKSRVN